MLRRLKPFDVKLHYTDRHRLPEAVEKELGLTYHPNVESMVKVCDVVTINCPLHPETEHLFNDKLIGKMKRGAYLVNTARGKICDRDAIVRALESGQLAGYAGDVWFPQPAPQDHPWRTMPHHGMTPHISGHVAFGPGPLRRRHPRNPGMLVRESPDPRRIPDREGRQAGGAGAHSYSAGDATAGPTKRHGFSTDCVRVKKERPATFGGAFCWRGAILAKIFLATGIRAAGRAKAIPLCAAFYFSVCLGLSASKPSISALLN